MSRKIKLLIGLIIFSTIAAYVLLVIIPSQMAKRSYEGAKTIAEDFRKAFQFTPEIRVNNTVVLNQQTSVLELAVLSQHFEHRYVWENSWLRSTKKIFISGNFQAKVGFDLNKRFSITLSEDKAVVRLPAPQALSVESLGDIQYRDEQGVWNWVSVDDRTRATNAFVADARRFADRASFVDDAQKRMESRLKALLDPYAEQVLVQYEPAADSRRGNY
jgi:hypothetical protein